MRIGIIGGGVVGHATARSYAEWAKEVRVYDIMPERSTHSFQEVVSQSDIIFLCLPTPQKANSLEPCLRIVDETFDRIAGSTARNANFCLKSTVPIGTTRAYSQYYALPNLCYSPEFLTARCALVDAQIPSRNIVGIPEIDSRGATLTGDNRAAQVLNILYRQRFPGVPTLLMSSSEAEAVKLFQNSFFAVKVAFWNECRALADKLGLTWETVINGILADGRIHPSHTQVPGPDGKRGFGGTCLPKDLANLISCGITHGVGFPIGMAALDRNRFIDRVGSK